MSGRGVTVRSAIDCLVAVLAEENGCAVLARDRALTAILSSGLVAVRFPPGEAWAGRHHRSAWKCVTAPSGRRTPAR